MLYVKMFGNWVSGFVMWYCEDNFVIMFGCVLYSMVRRDWLSLLVIVCFDFMSGGSWWWLSTSTNVFVVKSGGRMFGSVICFDLLMRIMLNILCWKYVWFMVWYVVLMIIVCFDILCKLFEFEYGYRFDLSLYFCMASMIFILLLMCINLWILIFGSLEKMLLMVLCVWDVINIDFFCVWRVFMVVTSMVVLSVFGKFCMRM